MLRKFSLYFFLLLLNIYCNGQEKSPYKDHKKSEDSKEQTFQKQKYCLEFEYLNKKI